MAQHDYVVGNDSGANVRGDINDALAAIVSRNSGPTEPSTTFAYMTWCDTTAGLIKERNAANSAWITKGQLGVTNNGFLSTGEADPAGIPFFLSLFFGGVLGA